ncbi:hypothetical protein BUALT_BualtUnG0046900 [Buddleja alternifolia]|uniref:RanBP2-type domain-containing protein n=1 Tax=Buddleja alternifolia TaxID=168488 RepID=A0AAV6W0Z5_9LAMI|nr:hypothetical protein BUALT_BualtUnG0046900 [Buddleja alternifolia]
MTTWRLFTSVAPSVLRNNSRILIPPPLKFNKIFFFPTPPPPSLRLNRYSSSSTDSDVDKFAAVSGHPWPEWVNFIDRLKAKGYFTENEKEGGGLVVYRDMNLVKDACLSFGRHRFDIFKSMSTQDIQIVVEKGCPNLLRKSVNSAKRLRAYLKLDEGDVCSSCNLRGSCDRAYIMLNDSEAAARTIDLVRILLFYALDPLVFSGENKPPGRDLVESSARKLLLELIELGETPPHPELPRPAPVTSQKKKQSLDLLDNESSKGAEMKRGDWVCTKCNFMNFAKNMRCLKCKAEGPNSVSLDTVVRKMGDWDCPQCSYMNFASNRQCFRCQEARPQRQLRPGDWECPGCDFVNFNRNTVCKKCNLDRPLQSARRNNEQPWTKSY